MGVFAAQVVDMQGDTGVIDETLEELTREVDIEVTDARASVIDEVVQTRTAGWTVKSIYALLSARR